MSSHSEFLEEAKEAYDFFRFNEAYRPNLKVQFSDNFTLPAVVNTAIEEELRKRSPAVTNSKSNKVSFYISTGSDSESDNSSIQSSQSYSNPTNTSSLFPTIHPELVERIEFIFIGDSCVFSKSDPHLWSENRIRFGFAPKKLISSYPTQSSTMKTCLEIFLNSAEDIKRFNCFSFCLMNVVLQYLSDREMIRFSMVSKQLRSICIKDSNFRLRRKEALASIAHELSKAKNLEKKKKIKQANVKKMTKKDAFARGGNDGMR